MKKKKFYIFSILLLCNLSLSEEIVDLGKFNYSPSEELKEKVYIVKKDIVADTEEKKAIKELIDFKTPFETSIFDNEIDKLPTNITRNLDEKYEKNVDDYNEAYYNYIDKNENINKIRTEDNKIKLRKYPDKRDYYSDENELEKDIKENKEAWKQNEKIMSKVKYDKNISYMYDIRQLGFHPNEINVVDGDGKHTKDRYQYEWNIVFNHDIGENNYGYYEKKRKITEDLIKTSAKIENQRVISEYYAQGLNIFKPASLNITKPLNFVYNINMKQNPIFPKLNEFIGYEEFFDAFTLRYDEKFQSFLRINALNVLGTNNFFNEDTLNFDEVNIKYIEDKDNKRLHLFRGINLYNNLKNINFKKISVDMSNNNNTIKNLKHLNVILSTAQNLNINALDLKIGKIDSLFLMNNTHYTNKALSIAFFWPNFSRAEFYDITSQYGLVFNQCNTMNLNGDISIKYVGDEKTYLNSIINNANEPYPDNIKDENLKGKVVVATLNINPKEDKNAKIQIQGSVINYAGVMNVNLLNSDSYVKGIMTTGKEELLDYWYNKVPGYEDINKHKFYVKLENGAKWIPSGIVTLMFSDFKNNHNNIIDSLTLNEGIIDLTGKMYRPRSYYISSVSREREDGKKADELINTVYLTTKNIDETDRVKPNVLIDELKGDAGAIIIDLDDQNISKHENLEIKNASGQHYILMDYDKVKSFLDKNENIRLNIEAPQNSIKGAIFRKKGSINQYKLNLKSNEEKISRNFYTLDEESSYPIITEEKEITKLEHYLQNVKKEKIPEIKDFVKNIKNAYDMSVTTREINNIPKNGDGIWAKYDLQGNDISSLLQIGIDKTIKNGYLGLSLANQTSKFNYNLGKGISNIFSILAYGGIKTKNNINFDAVARYSRIFDKYNLNLGNGIFEAIRVNEQNKPEERIINRIKNEGAKNSFSVVGLDLNLLKQFNTKNIFITPYIGASYSHIFKNTYKTKNLIEISREASNSLIGRIGLSLGKNILNIKAEISREFMGDMKYKIKDIENEKVEGSVNNKKTYFDISINGEYDINKKMTVDYRAGYNTSKKWNLGLVFRYKW